MMDFNKDKFKDLMHYIIYRCESNGDVEKTLLCKLLYFSDSNYLELYGESLTNESYGDLPDDPSPAHLDVAVEELTKEEKIRVKIQDLYDKGILYNFSSLAGPEISFNEKELNVIDSVIEKASE